jgi:serine/threonine protein kinase
VLSCFLLVQVIANAKKRNAPLGEKQVLGWFSQACLGIEYLHTHHHVLHRDIKPNNLFLMESSRFLKIGDFGLAKALEGPDQVQQLNMKRLY